MILDTLDNLKRYTALHPAFPQVIEYLRKTDLSNLAESRYEIDGNDFYVIVGAREGKTHAGTRLETHRNYLDIQITVAGDEEIGWKSTAALNAPQTEYDGTKDVQYLSDVPTVWSAVPAGHFAIFWPEDAHADSAGTGTFRKAIVKLRLK